MTVTTQYSDFTKHVVYSDSFTALEAKGINSQVHRLQVSNDGNVGVYTLAGNTWTGKNILTDIDLANQILSGDIQRIEFGHETGADPNVIKHFIAFWHTDGTKSVLSFNNGNIFYDYWDKIQWVNLWTK